MSFTLANFAELQSLELEMADIVSSVIISWK